MKAITTKYIGPSNTKPSRVKAFAEGGNSVTISFNDDEGGVEGAHWKAAKALCEKMGWKGEMACGGTETGFVFVFVGGVTYGVK